jgi:oligosaccharide reducing-end xylanase
MFMKTAVVFFSIMALTASVSLGGSVAAPYQIGTWEGFRPAAISYTFDDDLPNQYAKAVPMFNAMGFKLTLFTVTTWLPGGSWSPLTNAASFGHEIASHTVTHPILSGLSNAQQTNELKNSQAAINANVPGQKCLTLAYPNCVEANEAITSQYYIAARGCSGQLVPSTPANFLNISSFVCGPQGSVQTAKNFNDLANSAAAANAWCVYLIHAIDNDNGYSPLSSVTLQASVNYMNTNRDKFWVETFGNVVRYIRERNASSVTETSSGNDSITIQVTNNLDNSIYNYPITLRRPLPVNWPAAAVSQNNTLVSAQLVTLNSTNYVMFDVVPDGGDVIISKTALPPVLSNPVLNIPANFTFRLDGQTGVSYAIYSSTNLINWLPVQTNTMADTYTNFTVAASNPVQFYRAQWVP